MPTDHASRDREPAPGSEPGAGSVVVGVDPSPPAGVVFTITDPDPELLAARTAETTRSLRRFRDGMARMAPVVEQAAQTMARSMEGLRPEPPMSEYDAGDGMRWSPPAGGEETPPCPA